MAYRKEELTFYAYTNIKYIVLFFGEQYFHYICRKTKPHLWGTADIFRGFMVSLYVKGKENGHGQAYAPTGAMGLKRWGGLTSKLDGLPIASDPYLWRQACP